jgi:hypothetical protein
MARKTLFERMAASKDGVLPPAEDGPEMPGWFDAELHRVEPRGIVLAATGDLLAEDGLPVNAAARAAWAKTDAAEAVAAQPTAEQE